MAVVDDEVIAFVAALGRAKREELTPETTLLGDLGIDGADGWETIEHFAKRFEVDCSSFKARQFFGPEAGPMPWSPLVWLWQLFHYPGDPPEARAGLTPIHISDLIAAARLKKWTL